MIQYQRDTILQTVQDAVCAYRRFAGDPEQVFFGVFDGHGQHGTSCAQFAKDKVYYPITEHSRIMPL